jgi:hypothetical protein
MIGNSSIELGAQAYF